MVRDGKSIIHITMKTNKLFFLAAAAVLFANCTNQEMDVPFQTGTAVAVMETDDTKSDVDDQGYFTWSSGDQITIHAEGAKYVGTLSDGSGTPNGTFSYTYTGTPEFTGYAMYPHSDNHSITGNTLTFHMPATYELGKVVSNTNAPMLARPSGERSATASYSFSHLGGVIRVVFNNAPAGTDKFTLSLGGSKINGDFEVDLNADVPQIATTESETENLTTLTFDALETVQNITLFVPVPTGNYTGIEAKLYAGETLLGTWGNDAAVNDIARRALVLMAPITFSSAGGNIENGQPAGTQAQLNEAIEKGGTIVLTSDINLTDGIVIPADKELVIDLNGRTLSGTATSAAASNMITVKGNANLTIKNGTVTFAATTPDTQWGGEGQPEYPGYANNTIRNEGVLVVENAIIENKTSKGGASYVIDNYKGAKLVVNEGSVLTQSGGDIAIRMFNGSEGTIDVTINGGRISGYRAVWVQLASNAPAVAPTMNLTVNGGILESTDATYNQAVYSYNHGNDMSNVNINVTNGVFNGDIALTGGKNKENIEKVTISGGTFNGVYGGVYSYGDGEKAVEAIKITGGTFSDPTACNYLGTNADVTVKMTADYTGPGFKVESGQKISLDLGNKTYTVTAPLVGSPGTQTLGFQFLSGSTINISNGTITSSAAKMLINNYTDLTLNNVILSPTVENLDLMTTESGKVQTYYVLSNNSGTVNINGNTTIKAPVLDGLTSFAFDVCKYSTYIEPHVIWNSTGTVDGNIELSGGKFELNNDLNLTGVIKVTGTSEVVLNDWDITSGSDVFDVTGNLTVSGTDEAKVTAKSGVGSTCAVWVHNNGTATINGGYYSVGADKDGLRNDCIYAGSKSEQSTGTITINGGKFEYTGPKSDENEKDGDLFLINRYDMTPESVITVNGGTFKNHVPGYESTEPDRESAVTLGEGKKVVKTEGEEEIEVTAAHTGDTDVWYTVK